MNRLYRWMLRTYLHHLQENLETFRHHQVLLLLMSLLLSQVALWGSQTHQHNQHNNNKSNPSKIKWPDNHRAFINLKWHLLHNRNRINMLTIPCLMPLLHGVDLQRRMILWLNHFLNLHLLKSMHLKLTFTLWWTVEINLCLLAVFLVLMLFKETLDLPWQQQAT